IVATVWGARPAASPQPSEHADRSEPDGALLEQTPAPGWRRVVGVDQLPVHLDLRRRRAGTLDARFRYRNPARQITEGFRRAHRADLRVVHLLAIETQSSGA